MHISACEINVKILNNNLILTHVVYLLWILSFLYRFLLCCVSQDDHINQAYQKITLELFHIFNLLQDQIQELRIKTENSNITRKRFSEKPIVAFTNNTVFILDFCIYDKACSVLCFSLECLDLKKAQIISYQVTKTNPDCIRCIIGVFCYNLNHRRTFLLNTLACVKAEI